MDTTPQPDESSLGDLIKESFVLILTLFFTTIWVVYITYYNSRVFAIFITAVLNKFHRHGNIHIGSISISVLSGKLMFRDVAYITNDFSVRVQDGYVIFRWWRIYKPSSNEEEGSQVSTRLNILLNGFELHCYNRSTLYANLEHLFGLSVDTFPPEEPSNIDSSSSSELETNRQDSLWRDFFGVIKVDIFTGHIVFGNKLTPTVLRIGAEETHITYTTKAASCPHDEYSHDIKCKGEGLKIMFSPSPRFEGEQVDPPRFMGEGFVVLQSNNFDVHYFYDEPGYVKEGQENEPPPVLTMHLTCGKATTISYGPWADRQRDFLQKVFYPADYKVLEKTPPVNVGEKRKATLFDFYLNMVEENTLDILFTTDSVTDAIHISTGKGSYLETSFPLTVEEDGYKTEVKGQLFNVEATTSLAFSRFIETEALEYSIVVEHPLVWNHHQNWKINLDFSHTLVHLIYQHKLFLTDLLSDWSGKGLQDLMSFVPYTMHLNCTLNQFELNLMCNEYNWMDCTSPNLNNTCIAFNGEQMDISLVLPFSDFLPVVVPVKIIFKVGPVTGYLHIPESFTNYHTLIGIDQATKSHVEWPVPRPDWASITNKPGWIECASVPYLGLSIVYSYHPVPSSECVPLLKISDCKNGKPSITVTKIGNKLHTTNRRQPRWREVVEPGNLPADNMSLELDIGPAVLVAYGSILKAVLALKENYLGVDIDYMDLGRPLETQPIQKPLDKPEERIVNPLSLRPLQVTFALTVHTLQAYLPTLYQPAYYHYFFSQLIL
ncbi:bridge-like lipid transfer protein family member 1 [Antedon mediterranea]|uniref:bridge-like lipid transfer protein family member 1 n=1 Tax=Antedon mediterranea TaxID=105859 RepID=UPI003AF88DA0